MHTYVFPFPYVPHIPFRTYLATHTFSLTVLEIFPYDHLQIYLIVFNNFITIINTYIAIMYQVLF